MTRIVIVGVGDDGLEGLTDAARRFVTEADLVLGSESTLRGLAAISARREALDPDMTAAAAQVRAALSTAERPVLASQGDPLFYGVARYLIDRIGKESFEIVPHVSSMQLAFARIKESWEDAYLTSLAGRPIELVIDRIRTADKVGLFSSEDCPPGRLARAMLAQGIDYFHAYICENLGQPDERVTSARLSELVEMSFEPMHVLILTREAGRPDRAAIRQRRLFGNPDDAFAQSQPKRGLITQAEVRSIALGQMDIRPSSVVWDIGAGSGSVAIEAAQLASSGVVFAIEPDATDLNLLQSNCEAFGVPNVRAVAGRAPEALRDLPDPDAVFVGGSGRHVTKVMRAAFERLVVGGNMAVNVVTLEALTETYRALKDLAGEVALWQVAVSRGIEQLDRARLQAVNPTFLLVVQKTAAAPKA